MPNYPRKKRWRTSPQALPFRAGESKVAHMLRWGSARFLIPVLGVLVIAGMTSFPAAAATPPSGTWYKVDLHQHSSFSGDARADPGIDATLAKQNGYNAVMLTDHDRAASFQIQGANGDYLS